MFDERARSIRQGLVRNRQIISGRPKLDVKGLLYRGYRRVFKRRYHTDTQPMMVWRMCVCVCICVSDKRQFSKIEKSVKIRVWQVANIEYFTRILIQSQFDPRNPNFIREMDWTDLTGKIKKTVEICFLSLTRILRYIWFSINFQNPHFMLHITVPISTQNSNSRGWHFSSLLNRICQYLT